MSLDRKEFRRPAKRPRGYSFASILADVVDENARLGPKIRLSDNISKHLKSIDAHATLANEIALDELKKAQQEYDGKMRGESKQPFDWVEKKDAKTGRSYYANLNTKKTQWKRPQTGRIRAYLKGDSPAKLPKGRTFRLD